MSDTSLGATVKNAWQGVSGKYWAHVRVDTKPHAQLATVYGENPFVEDQRIRVVKTADGYALQETAGS